MAEIINEPMPDKKFRRNGGTRQTEYDAAMQLKVSNGGLQDECVKFVTDKIDSWKNNFRKQYKPLGMEFYIARSGETENHFKIWRTK